MTTLSYGDALCAAREREIDADESRAKYFEKLVQRERTRLLQEFVEAAQIGSAALVSTPGWGHCKAAKLTEVIDDLMAGKNDYQSKLMDLLAVCQRSEDMAVRFLSQTLVHRMAAEHAEFHADDAATEKME